MKDIKAIQEVYAKKLEASKDDDRLKLQATIIQEATAMMAAAELKFGPRNLDYSISRIEFQNPRGESKNFPMTSLEDAAKKTLIIELGEMGDATEGTEKLFKLRLAHEIVHCLGYSGNNTALEEGCACANGCQFGSPYYMEDIYEDCHKLLANLRNADEWIIKRIREKRKNEGKSYGLSDIEMADIAAELPDYDTKIIEDLLSKFIPEDGRKIFPNMMIEKI